MTAPEPEIVIEASADDLARSTATRTLTTLATALRDRDHAHLVLTGGSILEAVMRAISADPVAQSLDWDRVEVWWADERFVASDSDDRNEKAARAALLDQLPLTADLVHAMPPSDGPYPDLDAAASAYAGSLTDVAPESDTPRFDVVLLGVGPDGHCASLFPGHPATLVDDASVVAVRNSPKPPPERLSFTFRTLDAADQVWFVASGAGKADAVGLAFSGADRVKVPSSGPRGRSHTLWLVDADAAAGLPPELDPRSRV